MNLDSEAVACGDPNDDFEERGRQSRDEVDTAWFESGLSEALAAQDDQDGGASGACADAGFGAVVNFNFSACLVDIDGRRRLAIKEAAGLGPMGGTSVGGGLMVSNASDFDDLDGPSLCAVVTVKFVVGAGETVCLGVETDEDGRRYFSGIFTAYTEVGVGLDGGGAVFWANTAVGELPDAVGATVDIYFAPARFASDRSPFPRESTQHPWCPNSDPGSSIEQTVADALGQPYVADPRSQAEAMGAGNQSTEVLC